MANLERQMVDRDREMVPRILVQAMFVLMFSALALVSYARWTDRPLVGVPPDSAIVEEVSLVLEGTREGTVTVYENGQQVAFSGDNKMGFIGVIWRVIDRERMLNDADKTAPVRLVRHENGTLAILDDTTGWSVELVGYGPDNVAAFAKLID